MADTITIEWRPIDTHPRDGRVCLLAIFVRGKLEVADQGGWKEGTKHEEWDEVADGVRARIDEWQDEGSWWSNHCIIEEPTHWAEVKEPADG